MPTFRNKIEIKKSGFFPDFQNNDLFKFLCTGQPIEQTVQAKCNMDDKLLSLIGAISFHCRGFERYLIFVYFPI